MEGGAAMTHAQLKPFFRAVNRAASSLGIVGREAVEEYRHAVMREEVGVDHAADVDSADGYDRVMYRLALDGGDWAAAARYATGEERRMAALVESCARQVIELKAVEDPATRVGDAVDYVVGCLRQAGYIVSMTLTGDWWADISANQAFQVFRMLDTHRRRLLRRLGWGGTLSFDISAAWTRDGDGLAVSQAEDVPPPIRIGRPTEAA